MKKTILLIVACATQVLAQAQVEVTTKGFELESVKKHKGWTMIDAGRDPNTNNVYVKFAQPVCDVTRNGWSGTSTYRGLKWSIDKISFDEQFVMVNNEQKKYESSEDAMVNNEYVFGKTYMPTPATLAGNTTLIGVGKTIFKSNASLTRQVNNAFMFKNVVTGTGGISGFKVNVSVIGCQPTVSQTKGGEFCGEIPVVETVDVIDTKEEKGQKWIPMFNNPVPDGGNILFNTVGVGPEDKQHYVFRKYDAKGGITKEVSLSFDYQCLPTVKEIEKAPGVFDYVMIMTPINYKKSKLTVAPANQYEYIRIDGETFAITEQFKFLAPNSQWVITEILESNGSVYLQGISGIKNTVYKDFAIPKWKEYTAIQIAKVANGKLQYATSIDEKKAQTILKVVPGIKGSAKASFHNSSIKLQEINGRLFISAQNNFAGKLGPLVAMVFDQSGNMENYLAKPEKIAARGSLHFSADGKSAYWLLHDYGVYNKFDSKTGVLTAKKFKFLANALQVVKYDIETKQAAPIQSFINDEWALDYNNTNLYETSTEIVLLGKKLTKKAKESEIVFVKIKK